MDLLVNIALKTAEGTANFITSELRKALTGNIIGKISSLLNIKNINSFKKKLDPRLYNGAIFVRIKFPRCQKPWWNRLYWIC
jgi:Fatty acid/phospholipid biosynthesis enzyme